MKWASHRKPLHDRETPFSQLHAWSLGADVAESTAKSRNSPEHFPELLPDITKEGRSAVQSINI